MRAVVTPSTPVAASESRCRHRTSAPVADQRADRWRQGHRVVGVEDPGHEAEREAGDEQPAEPEGQPGARREPAAAAGEPEGGDAEHQRGRDQPGDLGPDLGAEHPEQPGRTPLAARGVAPADRAGLGAVEPAEAVVAEGELEDRVVLRAADVGPRRGRPEAHDRDPPAGGEDHPGRSAEQVEDLAAPGDAGVQRVDRDQRRDHQERLQHLRQEREPDEHAGEGEPAGRATGCAGRSRHRGLDGAQGGVRRPHEQQDEHRVGVVEAEHQHRDRGQRHHRAGEQPGAPRARRTTDRGVEQTHRRHSLERLRHQDAPRREPEEPDGQAHRPERQRCLVDGDGAGGVGGAEEERLPRLGAGLGGRGVERVRPAGRAQPPQVEDRGREEQTGERQPLGRHGETREREPPPGRRPRPGNGGAGRARSVTRASPARESPPRESRARADEVVSEVMPRLSLPGLSTPRRPPVPPL